jgi:hypothetical protein
MERLRDRMCEDLTLRGMSAATIDTYVRCARKFVEHVGRSPGSMGAQEVRAFSRVFRGRVCRCASRWYSAALRSSVCYGAGLRVSEICRLCIDDVDAKRMVLRIRSHEPTEARRRGDARRTWRERRSVPASSKCVAKECRSVCGETRLARPARRAASPAFCGSCVRTGSARASRARPRLTGLIMVMIRL